jgi:hypothetical protein
MMMDDDAVNKDVVVVDVNDDGQVATRLIKKDTTIKYTYHHINQLRNGLDEGPDPFPVGLWVDGTVGCTNDHTPWALLGVNL